MNPTYTVEEKTFYTGKNVPITQLNMSRYSINFFINGDIELIDVIEALKVYGQVVEITFKTY